MAKMCFPNVVKYNDKVYSAHVPFTVKEADVEELSRKGGWLVDGPKKFNPLADTITTKVDKK